MKKPSKKNLIIILCATALVLIITAISVIGGNNPISNAVGTVASPVQKAAAVAVNSVKDFFTNVVSSGKNAKENKELNKKLLELESQIRMLEGYKTENEELRELIELSENRFDFNTVGANIIARDISEFKSVITIDKGTMHGIQKGAVVIVPEGLVGVVYEAGVNYSKVRTIFDRESSVSGVCPRSGDMGIVESASTLPKDRKCSMNYIDKSAKTVVGDMIETSGTGGVFPKGILIGKVTEIKDDSRNLTLTATVEAGVNLNNIDKVLVSR